MRALALLALLLGGPAAAQEITGAELAEPTDKYGHGILGDGGEWDVLNITVGRSTGDGTGLFTGSSKLTYAFDSDENLLWEDVGAKLWDTTGDGKPEVVVVQSHMRLGARLMVLALTDGKPAYWGATPFIGTAHRWLAPLGAADLDGDGQIEIAYIDRPHLAKTLRIWRHNGGDLVEVASKSGLTTHKIGWDFIAGGLRTCGGKPEMITANGDWSRVVASTLVEGRIESRDLGPYEGPKSLSPKRPCD